MKTFDEQFQGLLALGYSEREALFLIANRTSDRFKDHIADWLLAMEREFIKELKYSNREMKKGEFIREQVKKVYGTKN